jgi:two-component system LytT family sensor kinase
MKKFSVQRIINPRSLSTHIIILLFSLAVAFIDIVNNADVKSWSTYFGGFIVTFIQLELFIVLAHVFFKNVTLGRTPGEITRIVLSRFALFFIACFATALLVMLAYLHISQALAGGLLKSVTSEFFQAGFSAWFKPTFVGLLFGGIVFIIILWQDTLRREQRLREENLIFQNETLRNQVNPHFLFNSLNTLSSLMVTQAELAEQFINRMASIYRYILENIGKDKIPLTLELAFIRDYIELHKIRDEGKILLTIDVPHVDMFKIIPVSLQILVENAIKHNKATPQEPLMITISLEENQVVVKNNLQKMATQIRTTGIGLENLSNRVKLVSGKELVIKETTTYYLVKVPLL